MYNSSAQNFYSKNGYFNRNIEMMKKIWIKTENDEKSKAFITLNLFKYKCITRSFKKIFSVL